FGTVLRFVEERSQKLLLKDRIHCIWFCVKTPTAGGRVFETGDEKILEYERDVTGGHQSVPLVLVFTQYDRLVATMKVQLRGKPNMDE
ncbi:hypothetical protein EI94DRAFT_1536331, partial [Lactarius quietus]